VGFILCAQRPHLDSKRRHTAPKVLALAGADDPFVPPDQRLAFQDEMRQAKADWQMIIYGGAVHSLTNPASGDDLTKGVAYNEKADRRSWAAMKQFFAEVFG
jgi:dienelactone hydrolase